MMYNILQKHCFLVITTGPVYSIEFISCNWTGFENLRICTLSIQLKVSLVLHLLLS